ncbi:MAG: hypothetical protein Q4P15_01305 [Propionibacteriaceae bacterium]|nr:hypothetical protein [Propionibacteriaceae bacterium]
MNGEAPEIPESDSWREDVVAALEGTPGVTSVDVTVNEFDDGGGGKGPVIYGKFTVTHDSQAVVEEAMRRMSDALGPDSRGVGLNLSITTDGATGANLRDFGYGDVRHGRELWEATH